VTLYSVYEPPGEALDPEERAEALVFVKEGFSGRLLVPGYNLLYRRMARARPIRGAIRRLGWGSTRAATRRKPCSAG
jgi:hypothetical protein